MHERSHHPAPEAPLTAPTGDGCGAPVVLSFAPATHTRWLHHPVAQSLSVLSGTAVLQLGTAAARRVAAGETVLIPAEAAHWYGAALATPGAELTRIEIAELQPTTEARSAARAAR
ncbi:MAG: hypothetical protein AAFW69_08015 [Pseudomonadota bacterium]